MAVVDDAPQFRPCFAHPRKLWPVCRPLCSSSRRLYKPLRIPRVSYSLFLYINKTDSPGDLANHDNHITSYSTLRPPINVFDTYFYDSFRFYHDEASNRCPPPHPLWLCFGRPRPQQRREAPRTADRCWLSVLSVWCPFGIACWLPL